MVNKDRWRRFYSVLSILIQPQIGLSDGAARQIAPGVLNCFSRLMSHTSQDHVQSPNDIIWLACQPHHDSLGPVRITLF